jgi:hypothetical protein
MCVQCIPLLPEASPPAAGLGMHCIAFHWLFHGDCLSHATLLETAALTRTAKGIETIEFRGDKSINMLFGPSNNFLRSGQHAKISLLQSIRSSCRIYFYFYSTVRIHNRSWGGRRWRKQGPNRVKPVEPDARRVVAVD